MWFVAILIWIISTGCCSYDIAAGILIVLCVLLVIGLVVAAILLRAGVSQAVGKPEFIPMAVPSDIQIIAVKARQYGNRPRLFY